MKFNPEQVDLHVLSLQFQRTLGEGQLATNYLEGKTRLRDILAASVGCSQLEAEQVVDTMIARGFMVFRKATAVNGGASTMEGHWEFRR